MENQAPKQNQSVPVASAKNRILTKEKLCKRRWQGLSSCEFCGLFESTDHLFFKCSVARYIWRVAQIALNLHTIPTSTDDLFGPWIHSFSKIDRNVVMFGCGAVLWSIWRTRNDKVFNGKMLADPSNAVFLCCFWLDTWAILQKKKEKRIVELGSLRIRKTASDAFCRAFGWSPVGWIS